jgi:hypothetical protein
MQINLDSADAPRFLELAQVKFRPKKPFGLTKNRADYVGFFNYAFNFKSRVYNILYGKGLGCSRKCYLRLLVNSVS